MEVTNNTSFKLIAFGFHSHKGRGEPVEIEPGKTEEVNGPYLGEMGGGSCYVALMGKISCQGHQMMTPASRLFLVHH